MKGFKAMTDKTELRTFCNDLMKASSPLSKNYTPSPMAVYAVARYALQRLDAPGPRLTPKETETLARVNEALAEHGELYRSDAWELVATINRLSAQPKETGKVEQKPVISVNCEVCGEGTPSPCKDDGHAYSSRCWRYSRLMNAPEKAEGETP